MSHAIGRLHVLTDYYFQQRFSPEQLAEMAIAGGADTIQFRQKNGHIRHKLTMASQVAGPCREAKVPLIIDDYIEIVLAISADGLHLGQNDFPLAEARNILTPGVILGATATTLEQAKTAWKAGADYIGFGPVYPTTSKANPARVKGISGLQAVCEAVPIPVIAIGGITAEQVPDIMKAGAHGIAVMSAVCNAEDPVTATRCLSEAIYTHIPQLTPST